MFDGAVCTALWRDERCLVKDISLQGPGIYTLYAALVCMPMNAFPVLTGDASTKVFLRPPQDAKTCWRLKDLCSGLGGIAVGMLATGGSLLASADRCSLACSTLRLNHSSVIQGDLQDRATRVAVHDIRPAQAFHAWLQPVFLVRGILPKACKEASRTLAVTPLYTYCSTCGTHKHTALSWNVCLPSPKAKKRCMCCTFSQIGRTFKLSRFCSSLRTNGPCVAKGGGPHWCLGALPLL